MDKPTEQPPLDSLFRRKLDGASVPPSAEAWERLQSRLASAQPVGESAAPNRRLGGWLWYGSAAVGVAACLLLVFMWTTSENPQAPPQNTVASSGVSQPKLSDNKAGKSEQNSQFSLSPQETEPTQLAGSTVGQLEMNSLGSRKSAIVEFKRDDTRVVQHKIEEPQKPQPEPAKQNRLIETPVVAQMQTVTPHQVTLGQPAQSPQTISPPPSAKLPVADVQRTLIVQVPDIPTQRSATVASNDETPTQTNPVGASETKLGRAFRQIKRIKDGEVFAKADDTRAEDDDESGLFDRLVRSGRSKDNTTKQQK